MAVCVAVLGKENSPNYFNCIDPNLELQFHYKMHTALDFIEEKLSSSGKNISNESRELYLGLLYSTQDYKLYGYVTNTKVKFMIAVDVGNLLLRDNEIRSMFRALHVAYCDTICSPFYIPGDPIESITFNNTVKSIMEEIV